MQTNVCKAFLILFLNFFFKKKEEKEIKKRINSLTSDAPEPQPNRVIKFGSPPNAGKIFVSIFSAATKSDKAELPEQLDDSQRPKKPKFKLSIRKKQKRSEKKKH